MRTLQIVVGLAIVAAGVYLALSPLVVADALGRPHETTSQLINLRASWGGAVMGLGAFVAWFPGPRPRLRALLGLVLWAMAGVGLARVTGFVLDGAPDTRQIVWITAEAALVIGCALGLRAIRSRRARR